MPSSAWITYFSQWLMKNYMKEQNLGTIYVANEQPPCIEGEEEREPLQVSPCPI